MDTVTDRPTIPMKGSLVAAFASGRVHPDVMREMMEGLR